MVVVPNVTPDVPPLRKNPVFLYYSDRFKKPAPFRPDVVVAIDEVLDIKIRALDAHTSQFYEWLPWVDGELDKVPKDPAARLAWLRGARKQELTAEVKASLVKWYGATKAAKVDFVESFEICEYGKQPKDEEIRKLFPMLN